MRELIQEVITSMKSNRMRIALTGFSIGWGMFILVILLGSSGGFQRGLYKTFHLDKEQIVRISVGKTSQAWNGLNKGRTLKLHLEDAEALAASSINHIRMVCPSAVESLNVGYGNYNIDLPVTGCYGNYLSNDYRKLIDGRDINELDNQEKRKVCVINTRLAKQFFGDKKIIGNELRIGESNYLVVGLCESTMNNDMSFAIYIPLSVMVGIYRHDGVINSVNLIVENMHTAEQNEQLVSEVQHFLSSRLGCAPTDNKGVKIVNSYEQVLSTQQMIAAIGVFVWIIGLATLIAGIVGVSNIMMITVKERTRELGVRKVMGASNANIISLVLIEAVIITMIFGYVGMMCGIGITQLLDMALGSAVPMFQNPTVQFGAVIGCNVIMVLAGVIAGYVPAKRAVSIKLVDALTS